MSRYQDEDGLWSLTCDVCRDGWYELDGEVRFSARSDLEGFAALSGWSLSADRVLCSSCSLAVLCGRAGHRWGAWSVLETTADLAAGRRVRFCQVCSSGEYDPPLS